MPPAEPPTPAPEDASSAPEPRPLDGPVPAGPPPGRAGSATPDDGRAGADDDAEYEPL
ncbi:hypothetical protein ACWC4J_12530 [Streptomyces sp. NPDC001356]